MKRIVLGVFLVVALATGIGLAQVGTGTVSGTVVDATGAVIPGVKITLQSAGRAYKAESDSVGQFVLANVEYGFYRLTAEAAGFRRLEVSEVKVQVAQVTPLRLEMEVGSVAETVTVTEAPEIVNTTATQLTATVDKKQIEGLPLVTRSPINLASLQAGVAVTTTIREGHVNGLRGQSNNITQDGINVQDNYIRNDGFFARNAPNIESTGEFSVTTSNQTASSGSGGAQVTIVTSRGTDDFHGSLYFYHRNDFLSANTWINNASNSASNPEGTPKARLHQHRFGYSLGGPVYIPKLYDGRRKTYFFTRYEGFRENFAVTRNRTVLTQSARDGFFSYRRTDNGQIQTVNLFGASSNTFGFNPVTLQLINATPLPNNPDVGDTFNTGGSRFNVEGSDPNDGYTLRFDHTAFDSPRFGTHRAELVWSWFDFFSFPDTFNSNEAPFPSNVALSCPGAMCLGAGQLSTRKLFAFAIHSTLGATMQNEVRFGFQRGPVTFFRENSRQFPRSFRLDFPLITDPERNFLQQGRHNPNYTFFDNFTKVWGRHTFKMGFQLLSRNVVTFNDAGIVPTMVIGNNGSNGENFAGGAFPGGISSADLGRARNVYQILTGLLGSAEQTFNAIIGPPSGFLPNATNAEQAREREYDGYFEDSWRLRPDFTLNYGVRYEFIRPVDMVINRGLQPPGQLAGIFSPYASQQLFVPDPSITFNQVRTGAVSPTMLDIVPRRGLWNEDWNNVAPFLGIAWSPDSDNFLLKTLLGRAGKGVLRGGLSVSYVREGLTVAVQPLRSNDGLVLDVGESFPLGVVSAGGAVGLVNDLGQPFFPFATPTLTLPRSQLDNLIETGAASGLFTFDPNLRTPYIIQWSFGIQREIAPETRLELRYVGNHGVKLIRGVDVGQINLLGNGMLQEFLAARQNLTCHRSTHNHSSFAPTGHACNVPLPILTGMGQTSFTSSARIQNLINGEAGEWAHQTSLSAIFFYFASNGALFPGLGNVAYNFFKANPLAFFADFIGNNAESNHHALQVEVFRRFSRGLFLQGNYTFGKTITDFDGDVQNTFFAHLSLTDPFHQRRRAAFDITHTFNFNTVWELPVGRGRRFLPGGIAGKILEGWQMGGIWQWHSGRPFSILSGRGTLNRNARSTTQNEAALLGLVTADDVCSAAGVNRERTGAFLLPSEFRAANGQANPAVFGHPAPGTLGDTGLRFFCDSPRVFNVDMNFVKKTSITERTAVEFRAEFFNIFNTPNFLPDNPQSTTGNLRITTSTFTQITNVGGTFAPREIQFNIRFLW